MGVIHHRLGFEGAEIFAIFWCLAHNSSSRYARKSIKGSEVVFLPSFQKNLAKNGSLNWRPGPSTGGQKNAKTPPFVTSPVENPNTKRKNIFLSKLEDFPKPDWV